MAKKLVVEIVGDSSSLDRAFRNTSKNASALGSSLKTLGKVAAVGVGAAFVGLGIVVKKGFDELAEGEKVAAQTAAVLKSTGEAANVTAKDVANLATAQSKLTGIDDEAVQAGENMLLTFRNIRNEVGAGNDIFNQATVAVEDMATAMNSGAIPSSEQLASTSIRVGKALNDPVKGMTALARVGVSFTDAQKKAVAQMIKSGDTMGAQKLILGELTKEFGGSAKAAGETFPGQLAKLRNAFDDASSKVAVVFLPALLKAMNFITDKLIPGMGKAADFIKGFWSGITRQLSKAPNLSAKVKIVLTGIETIAKQFVDALVSQIERLLPQKPLILQPQTKVAVGGGGVDWNKTADDMLAALGVALTQSAVLAQGLADAVSNSFNQVDWVATGKKLGPFLAAMVASGIATLSDPMFWIKNWDLVLAIAFAKFGGSFLKLGKPLIAPFAKLGGDMVIALAGGLERESPLLAKAFLAALLKLPALVKAPFTLLESLVGKAFGRLAKVAVFTIKVLGVMAAIGFITDFVSAASAKFGDLIDAIKRILAKIPTAIADAAHAAYVAATRLGENIVHGVIAGLGNLFSSVAKHVAGAIKSAVDYVKEHLGSTAEEYAAKQLGEPLSEGTLAGYVLGMKDAPNRMSNSIRQAIVAVRLETADAAKIIGTAQARGIIKGFLDEQPSAKQQMIAALRAAVQEAVQKAKQAVIDARSAFASAFGALADAALAAFDAKMQAYKPPAQVLLDKRALEKQKQDLTDAINQAAVDIQTAQQALNEALAGGDPEKIAAAQQQSIAAKKAYDDAIYNQQTFALEQQAIAQQAAHDKKAARERKNLEDDLNDVKTWLAKHPGEYEKATAKINAVLKQHGIDAKFWGGVIGEELAKGIKSSEKAVAAAAEALARALRKKLAPKHSPPEEGPLADIDTWGKGLVDTFLGGFDFSQVSDAATGFASAFKENLAALRGTSPADVTPVTDSLTTVTESFDTSTAAVTSLTEAVTTLPTLATTALTAFNNAVVAALKKLPEFLSPVTDALLAVAAAIHQIGADAYYTRNALRDTAAEIDKLRQLIGSSGAGNNPGRQHGGYVRAGGSYLVGEVGPELFTPSSSGRIHSSAATSGMGGGWSQVVNLMFYGPTVGTSREFEDTVRRALYDVQRRNPGSGLALA